MPDRTRQRIERLAASADPLNRAVARRLAGQLPRTKPQTPRPGDSRPRSRWAHVDLVDVFAHFGNAVSAAGQRLKSSHEPVHGSRSGTCLVAWPDTGRWWCSSCGGSGDAAAFVMKALGMRYPAAAAWLAERYGPPAESGDAPTRRRFRHLGSQRYSAAERRVVLGGGAGA